MCECCGIYVCVIVGVDVVDEVWFWIGVDFEYEVVFG